MSSSPLIAFPALALAASLAAVVYALRGRRVDDHPVCRKCGFDLFGKPSDSHVCSECGADLSRRRAVRVGRRETRRQLVKLAAPLMLVSLGLLGVQGWGKARGVDWNRHKPAWWLAREAGAADAATRDAALAELVRRIRDGTLPRDREEALVQKALDHQADWSQPWVPAWGAVVEAVKKAGRLSDARWEQYVALAVPYTLVPAQPGYRRAHDIGFNAIPGKPRWAVLSRPAPWRVDPLGLAGTYSVEHFVNETLVTNDQRHTATLPDPATLRRAGILPPEVGPPPRPGLIPVSPSRAAGGPTLLTRFDEAAAGRVGDGPQVTRMSLILAPFPGGRPAPGGLPPGTVTRELEAAWTLLSDARTDTDFDVRMAAREAISLRGVYHVTGTPQGRESTGRLECDVTCDAPPVDLVYKASFRWLGPDGEGAMRYAGEPSVVKEPVHFPKGAAAQRVTLRFGDARAPDAPPPQWAEVVFTPWPEAAPLGVDVIGGGDVVFPAVPVQATNFRTPFRAP